MMTSGDERIIILVVILVFCYVVSTKPNHNQINNLLNQVGGECNLKLNGN